MPKLLVGHEVIDLISNTFVNEKTQEPEIVWTGRDSLGRDWYLEMITPDPLRDLGESRQLSCSHLDLSPLLKLLPPD